MTIAPAEGSVIYHSKLERKWTSRVLSLSVIAVFSQGLEPDSLAFLKDRRISVNVVVTKAFGNRNCCSGHAEEVKISL